MTQTNDPPLISSLELIPDAAEKADLDAPNDSGGKLVIGQAPNITITETTVVADAAERLALDVQEGDVAIQQNVSSSFIFTGGDNIAPNWEVLDFDAVGAVAGEDISPNNINALGDILGQSIDVVTVNGADTSAASAGEALTSDGSGGFTFASVGGSQVLRNGSPIEYVALDIANLPPEQKEGDTALLTSTNEYVQDLIENENYDIFGQEFETSINSQDTFPSDIVFNNDGSRMYQANQRFASAGTQKIHQLSLSTAFDITTSSLDTSIDAEDYRISGLAWNDDGSRLYETGTRFENIDQYTVSNPFDIGSATLDTSINAQDGSPQGISWNDTGSKLYEIGAGSDKIYQYNVSTPFDIDTATFDTSINTVGGSPSDMAWNNDGSRLYEVNFNGQIHELTLSTAYDVTTASISKTIDSQDSSPRGIAWNDTGSKLYEIGDGSSEVYQYKFGTGGWQTI